MQADFFFLYVYKKYFCLKRFQGRISISMQSVQICDPIQKGGVGWIIWGLSSKIEMWGPTSLIHGIFSNKFQNTH